MQRLRSVTSLDVSAVAGHRAIPAALLFLSYIPVSELRVLGTEANKFYDRNHPLYDEAILIRCYTHMLFVH